MPCGYDDNTYRQVDNLERESNVILGVGRSFFQKNFQLTLEAWKLLGNKRPVMWLFGAEPELANLDPKIKYFTLPSNSDVNGLYNQATLFVQTSRHEGFCLPILEAMAAGCPVICTDAHGNRDFCFDGKNCLMVEQDNVQSVSTAIGRLMGDDQLRKRLVEEALETAKSFRWDAVIDKTEKFFNQIR